MHASKYSKNAKSKKSGHTCHTQLVSLLLDFSRFQVLCSVLNLFGFDFSLCRDIPCRDRGCASHGISVASPLGQGEWHDQAQSMKPAAPEALSGPAAVGHHSTFLRRAGLKLLGFFVSKHCSAFHQGMVLPRATLPVSCVLNQLYWEKKKSQHKISNSREA